MRKHLLPTLGTMLTLIATAGLLRAVAGPPCCVVPQAGPDVQFVIKAAAAGSAGIQLAQLARQKTASEKLKAVAERIETEHQVATSDLKALAARKAITVPEEMDQAHQAARDRLERLSGMAFDRAFAEQMVADHKAAIDLFATHMKTGADAEVRAFAAQQLPALRAHLKQSQDLLKPGGGTRARR